MPARSPGISAHDHARAISMTQMKEFFRLEGEAEILPERVVSVELVELPVVVHPRQRIWPILIPRVQKIERVTCFVHPRVEVFPQRFGFVVSGRCAGRQIIEPGMFSKNSESLSIGRFSGAAE